MKFRNNQFSLRAFVAVYAIVSFACATLSAAAPSQADKGVVVNDIHSRLNETTVSAYHEPRTKKKIVNLVKKAKRLGMAISISGGKHAMGGQQFGEGTIHLNMSKHNRVLDFDTSKGLVTVEAGIHWPKLIDWLVGNQKGKEKQWGIRQKQTGADKLSIGGAISANAHGRGLTLKPMVGDVDSFELVDADGKLLQCSREENSELFNLVIGGYGLFGVITEVTLRLSERTKLQRDVELIKLRDVPDRVAQRIQDGYLYGDYQFKTDENADDFLEVGVFSFYKPVPLSTPIKDGQEKMSEQKWGELYKLAHLDKSKAYQVYSDYYLSTKGQIYWSDTHQMSYYLQGYDDFIDRVTKADAPHSLMICEFYVPRNKLPDFLRKTAEVIREENANLVYGTVRYIAKDDETFLAWAKESFACTVMNLRVAHDAKGIEGAKRQFQRIIDVALSLEGSYFLTYHRWARKDQVLKAYPQFPEFLRLKKKYDPEERFQSEWYRHYRAMFSEELEN